MIDITEYRQPREKPISFMEYLREGPYVEQDFEIEREQDFEREVHLED